MSNAKPVIPRATASYCPSESGHALTSDAGVFREKPMMFPQMDDQASCPVASGRTCAATPEVHMPRPPGSGANVLAGPGAVITEHAAPAKPADGQSPDPGTSFPP